MNISNQVSNIDSFVNAQNKVIIEQHEVCGAHEVTVSVDQNSNGLTFKTDEIQPIFQKIVADGIAKFIGQNMEKSFLLRGLVIGLPQDQFPPLIFAIEKKTKEMGLIAEWRKKEFVTQSVGRHFKMFERVTPDFVIYEHEGQQRQAANFCFGFIQSESETVESKKN